MRRVVKGPKALGEIGHKFSLLVPIEHGDDPGLWRADGHAGSVRCIVQFQEPRIAVKLLAAIKYEFSHLKLSIKAIPQLDR